MVSEERTNPLPMVFIITEILNFHKEDNRWKRWATNLINLFCLKEELDFISLLTSFLNRKNEVIHEIGTKTIMTMNM